jgi:hypothetical protein
LSCSLLLTRLTLLTREAASDRTQVFGGCARLGQHRRAISAIDRGRILGAAGIRGIGVMCWSHPKVSYDPAPLQTPAPCLARAFAGRSAPVVSSVLRSDTPASHILPACGLHPTYRNLSLTPQERRRGGPEHVTQIDLHAPGDVSGASNATTRTYIGVSDRSRQITQGEVT